MEETIAVEDKFEKLRNQVTLALILLLLALRLPFLTGISIFVKPFPSWVMPIYENGTFLLTAVLLFWERKRLEQFHIGWGAVGIFILGPFVFSLYTYFYNPLGTLQFPYIHMIISGLLLLALLFKRPDLKKITGKALLWIIVSIAVGIAIGALYGYVNSLALPTPRTAKFTFPIFVTLFLRQLTWAATLEEPLFRGFLWGYLKLRGWKDVWICLFQAGLFLIAHSYYITVNLIIFINVFIAACILGFISWKSRSIANTMVVHGLFNSVGDIVSHAVF